jgi:ABC-2 type transport system permease protein
LEADVKRRLKLVLAFWAACIMRGTELRLPFAIGLADSMASMFLSIVFFEIIFSHVSSIAGWGKYGVFLLLGIYTVLMSLLRMAIRPGVSQLGWLVRNGDLDGLLVKPISSQFMISFRGFDLARLFDMVLGFVVVVYSLANLRVTPTLAQWTMAGIHIVCGLVIIYSLWYISLTLVIWTTVLGNWIEFVPNIFSFSQYPASIYRGTLRLLFTTAIPIAVVANLPARLLLGQLSWHSIAYSAIMAAIFLCASILFWHKALRYYSSASS